MKNILKCGILTMVFFLGINGVKALENVKTEELEDIYYHLEDSNETKPMNIIRDSKTNEVFYSLYPDKDIALNNYKSYTYFSTSMDNMFDYKDYIRLKELTYFGYGYKDRTDIKWYEATQMLIWQYMMGDSNKVYFALSDGNKKEFLSDEEQAILYDVENVGVIPSFTKTQDLNEPIVVRINEEIELTDTNEVLKDYYFKDNRAVNVFKDENKVRLSFNSSGTEYLTLTRNKPTDKASLFYYLDNNHALINRGNLEVSSTLMYLKILNPSLTIKLSNKENLPLEGGVYEIYYESGILFGTFTSNELGEIYVDEIPRERFFIREIKAPKGLENEMEDIYFEVIKENVELTIDKKAIYKDINIISILNNKEDLILNKDAKYELRDASNNLIKVIEADREGNINLSLTYGKYILKQIKTKDGYQKRDIEFYVSDDANVIKVYNDLIEVKKQEEREEEKSITDNLELKNDENTYFEEERLEIKVPNTGLSNNHKLWLIGLGLGYLGIFKKNEENY